MGSVLNEVLCDILAEIPVKGLQGLDRPGSVVPPRGVEPPANSLGNCCSIQLSYGG